MRIVQISIILSLITTLSFNLFAQENKTHKTWNELLAKYVDDKGHVNYKGFIEEKEKFDGYLNALEKEAPKESWTKDEKLAYWINVYNAFTVKLIIDNYPVKSIKDIGGNFYKINTAWDIKFINIEGEEYDLNNIEHGIIRKEFNEPRIHFAANCASASCPVLRNEAYVASKLDAQLTDQAKTFINDGIRNNITAEKAELSKLFKWYGGDFSKDQSVIEFINQFSETKIKETTSIDYLDYGWTLNE
jgi:hypothetical protein